MPLKFSICYNMISDPQQFNFVRICATDLVVLDAVETGDVQPGVTSSHPSLLPLVYYTDSVRGSGDYEL